MADLCLSQAELIEKYQKVLDKSGEHGKIESVTIVQPRKGENFASVCLYVTLQLTDGKTRELFIKQLPTNQMHLDYLANLSLFEKEAAFYNSLLPEMQKYWTRASGGTPMDFFPKCLHANEKETLLENLVKGEGYYLVPKTARQSVEHVKLTLKNLAKFHAVGYAMIVDAGGRDAFIAKYPWLAETFFLETNAFVGHICESGFGTAIDLLTNSKVPGADQTLVKLTALRSQAPGIMCRLVGQNTPHVFQVLNHGDAWNNNMLFKNDPSTGNPAHNVLVDFQVCRVGSPNLDLVYYLCMSMPTTLRRQNWSQLLSFYFEAFRGALEQLGHGGAKFPYTLDQFMADCHSKFPLGFFININLAIGMNVMSEIDMGGMPEGVDPMGYMKEMMRKWMVDSLDKADKYTKDLIEIWNEYEEIVRPQV